MIESTTPATHARQCSARVVRRWVVALAAALAATLSSLATAEEKRFEPPPAAKLKQWDARFMPGRYAIEEFDLDPETREPVAGGVKRTEACLARSDLVNISRLPFAASMLWQCEPLKAVLNERELRLAMSCPPTDVEPGPMAGVAVVQLTGAQAFSTVLMKFVPGKSGAADRVVFAKGSTAERQGDCRPQ